MIDFRSTDHWPRKRRRQWLFLSVLAGLMVLSWGLVLMREVPAPAKPGAASLQARR